MAAAAAADASLRIRVGARTSGTHRIGRSPSSVEWFEAGAPAAGRAQRRRRAASRWRSQRRCPPDECLLLLLSGGASALLASPADGLTLDDKRRTIETMMLAGADITALNTVRKHLSRVKGGRLAARLPGATVTLAVSDVVGDDVSVIGSGPGVPDETTWVDAAAALAAAREAIAHVEPVRRHVAEGLAGAVPETPKPDDPRLRRATGFVIASRTDALTGARDAAEALGYRAIVLDAPVQGEARDAAREWFATAVAAADRQRRRSRVRHLGRRDDRARHRFRQGRPQPGVRARAGADSIRIGRAISPWPASAPMASTARPTPPARSSIQPR